MVDQHRDHPLYPIDVTGELSVSSLGVFGHEVQLRGHQHRFAVWVGLDVLSVFRTRNFEQVRMGARFIGEFDLLLA